MEALQEFWTMWGTLITALLGSTIGSVVVGFVSSLVSKIVANKITGKIDVNNIISEVTKGVTQNVVQAITGSTLDVDVSAIVEEKLKETLGEITVEVKHVKKSVESMQTVNALTARALSRSKLLAAEEKAELVSAGETLSKQVERASKPVLKVKVDAKKESIHTVQNLAEETGAISI